MKKDRSRYYGHRFPPEIISYAVWVYHRFCLSFRDVEDLLAERGIIVSYETIRIWCRKFGPDYARKLKRRQGRLGDIWHLDEVFIRINGQQQYLWRAVDQDGDVIDIPPKGTAHAPIQICWPSPTVSLPPRCRPESFPSRTPLAKIGESPTLAITILWSLADSDSSLRRLQDNRPLRARTTPSRSS